jgi:Rrf2 family protein
MDIIRRNTDYALRLMNILAKFYQTKEAVSARTLSKDSVVPYPLTCKLLQKLQKNKIVKSLMGPRGGYLLSRNPDQISFREVIETIQGPIHINRCFLGNYQCPMKGNCPLHGKLMKIQNEIIDSLENSKISDLLC